MNPLEYAPPMRKRRYWIAVPALMSFHAVLAIILAYTVRGATGKDQDLVFGLQVALFGIVDFPATRAAAILSNDRAFWPGACNIENFVIWLLLASLWWGLVGCGIAVTLKHMRWTP
jgi:hypothetical protein